MRTLLTIVADITGFSSSYNASVLGAAVIRTVIPSSVITANSTGRWLRFRFGYLTPTSWNVKQAYFGRGTSSSSYPWRFDTVVAPIQITVGGLKEFTVASATVYSDPFIYTIDTGRNLILSLQVDGGESVPVTVPGASVAYGYQSYYSYGTYADGVDPETMSTIASSYRTTGWAAKLEIIEYGDAAGTIYLGKVKGRGYHMAPPPGGDDSNAVGFQDISVVQDAGTGTILPYQFGTLAITGVAWAHSTVINGAANIYLGVPLDDNARPMATAVVGAICQGVGTLVLSGNGVTNLIGIGLATISVISSRCLTGAVAAGTINVVSEDTYVLVGSLGSGHGHLDLDGLGLTGASGSALVELTGTAHGLAGIIAFGDAPLSVISGEDAHAWVTAVGTGSGRLELKKSTAHGIVGIVAHGDGTFTLLVDDASGKVGVVAVGWAQIELSQEDGSGFGDIHGDGTGIITVCGWATMPSEGTMGTSRFTGTLRRYDRSRMSGGS